MRVRMDGFPPLRGWAVRLLMDVPDFGYQKGYWMAKWWVGPENVEFTFEAELHMTFSSEDYAKAVSEGLRKVEMETEVVKVGN